MDAQTRFVRVTNTQGGTHVLNVAQIVMLNPQGPSWKVTMTTPSDIVLSEAEARKLVGTAF